ncbi:MAG TPA: hypothetical protein VGM80_15595 [Gaiellaceae bacterium]|jgi:hypothetical protein
MSPIAVVLLVAAVVLVIGAEWPRLSARFGVPARKSRARGKRKAKLYVVPDHEEFARAVERDLASLPTTDEKDAKRR